MVTVEVLQSDQNIDLVILKVRKVIFPAFQSLIQGLQGYRATLCKGCNFMTIKASHAIYKKFRYDLRCEIEACPCPLSEPELY